MWRGRRMWITKQIHNRKRSWSEGVLGHWRYWRFRDKYHGHRPNQCHSIASSSCLQRSLFSVFATTHSSATVSNIGSVQQKWSIFNPSFSINNEKGDLVMHIKGPMVAMSFFRDVEFKVTQYHRIALVLYSLFLWLPPDYHHWWNTGGQDHQAMDWTSTRDAHLFRLLKNWLSKEVRC